MNMNKMVMALAMVAPLLGMVVAEGRDFTVSIVGQGQKRVEYTGETLPLVYCPAPNQKFPAHGTDGMNNEPAANSFFVVIQNTQNAADKITMGASSWYDCLQFTIMDKAGNTYEVSHRAFSWSANPIETWVFPSSGLRVMPVNFTSGSWQGLPPTLAEPEIVTMTATFRYPDASGGMASVSSGPTKVYLCKSSPEAATEKEVKLRFVRVDSEETNNEDGFGKNAVDGDPNTYWHTQWQGNSPELPHEIILELVPSTVIRGFGYLPRQDKSDHGTIKDYEFYASDDGISFGQPVKKGTFDPGKGEKVETFDPIKCRFIKLKAISEINGLPWTSAAEIRVIQPGEDASAKNYWRSYISTPPMPADTENAQ